MTDKEILEWLRGQCYEGEGDCLIWKGGLSSASKTSALPTVRHPVIKCNMPARRALLMAMGVDIEGKCCTSSCGNPMCMSPLHAQAITRQELQKRSGKKLKNNLRRNAKLAAIAQGRSKLNWDQIREMRSSGMRATQCAQAYGIQLQHAARILRGLEWKDYTNNPFASLMG